MNDMNESEKAALRVIKGGAYTVMGAIIASALTVLLLAVGFVALVAKAVTSAW